MLNTTVKYSTHFNSYEIEALISEPSLNYELFPLEKTEIQKEQFNIFRKLENRFPIFNASSFGNQVHFQNASRTPIQRWFPYREGYSAQLVNTFLKELNIDGNVFDPFSGSGTTLLAARQNNLKSFGIDVNPISILVSKVENDRYIKKDIKAIEEEIKKLKILSKSSEIYSTSFALSEKVFNSDILQSLLQIKYSIKKIDDAKIQNIFFMAWLSIIENVSNIKKEGNGIKYKNRKRTKNGYINIEKDVWEKQFFPENKWDFIKSKLIMRLEIMLDDIKNNYGNDKYIPNIYQYSCLDFDKLFADDIQFTFYSPPYCNCFDYFEIHKVELWLGDFVKNKNKFKSLRNTGFRSNTNSLNHKPIIYKNKNIENLIYHFDRDRLWNLKIPQVIRGYFDDTHTLLTKLYSQTQKGGYVGIVVGSSAYTGVIIPTDIIIADIAKDIGFEIDKIFITRHLTTSSQQKKELEVLKNYLRESIVLLKK